MDELHQLPIPLLVWYREKARVLPWRSDPTPYHVWVSEIMLQQTRVAAVLDYYRRFLEAAPDVAALAALSQDQLMKLWQGLGYYSRARNLQKAAEQIMNDHGGVFPNTYEEIRALAGVGDYTAGAVGSIAFGLPVPAVDGNVLRVTARITGDSGDIATPAMKKKVTQALAEVIPLEAPGDFNQAMMELGATVCLPNGAPLCERCPAAGFCRAFQEGRTGELPVKAAKKARRVEMRIVYLLFYRDCVALRRRPDRGLLAGLWEYPNELDGGTDWLAQWGLSAPPLTKVGTGKHIFSHVEWHMTALAGELDRPDLPDGWVWADRTALRDVYAVPNAFQSFARLVADRLGHF
ncbi:A/G-specific adenine glycosylase [Lawsonibacter sp. JLR.KK007]|uniref:A/G-specific adenine glycosylase n=1 Tax=Lawsonibacter sp. JLR.KK007 TaxID=3114293 RepID=UPI002FEFF7F0